MCVCECVFKCGQSPGQSGSVFASVRPHTPLQNSAGPGTVAVADRGAHNSGSLLVRRESDSFEHHIHMSADETEMNSTEFHQKCRDL